MIGLKVKINQNYGITYLNADHRLVGKIGIIRNENGEEYLIEIPGEDGTIGLTRGCFDMIEELAFGKDAWVYCTQHMKPHLTGWCSVSNSDKLGLGIFGQ